MGGIAARDEACERPDCRQALIARVGATASLIFEMTEEPTDQLGREVRDGQPIVLFAKLSAGERDQQLEGVAVALAGVAREIPLGHDVLLEKASDPGAQQGIGGHSSLSAPA